MKIRVMEHGQTSLKNGHVGHAAIGVIGLGTMGKNLILNLADQKYKVALYDEEPAKAKSLRNQNGDQAAKLVATETLQEFVNALSEPRIIVLMIPAGPPVDLVINSLSDILAEDDLVIDAGNSDFHDTIRRFKEMSSTGLRFMGVGISGGKTGARFGPSIMVGGNHDDWLRIQPIFEAISAKHLDDRCAYYMGQTGAGHMVKSIHNGIEYADMQMISEIYGIMRDGLGMTAAQISGAFSSFNEGSLESYLIEISAEISGALDEVTGRPVLDVIQDTAGQKGTGRWASIEALNVGVPATTISAAVCARMLSSQKYERTKIEAIYGSAPQRVGGELVDMETMRKALMAGKVLCYAQGFELITRVAQEHKLEVRLPDVARVWRSGCIIRSKFLDKIVDAVEKHPNQLHNLPLIHFPELVVPISLLYYYQKHLLLCRPDFEAVITYFL